MVPFSTEREGIDDDDDSADKNKIDEYGNSEPSDQM